VAVSSNFKLKMKTIFFRGYSTIKMFLLRLGFSQKKAPNLYGIELSAYFVTTKVEKSNFYKDLNKLKDWEFGANKIPIR
jgi:hypothetical protein